MYIVALNYLDQYKYSQHLRTRRSSAFAYDFNFIPLGLDLSFSFHWGLFKILIHVYESYPGLACSWTTTWIVKDTHMRDAEDSSFIISICSKLVEAYREKG